MLTALLVAVAVRVDRLLGLNSFLETCSKHSECGDVLLVLSLITVTIAFPFLYFFAHIFCAGILPFPVALPRLSFLDLSDVSGFFDGEIEEDDYFSCHHIAVPTFHFSLGLPVLLITEAPGPPSSLPIDDSVVADVLIETFYHDTEVGTIGPGGIPVALRDPDQYTIDPEMLQASGYGFAKRTETDSGYASSGEMSPGFWGTEWERFKEQPLGMLMDGCEAGGLVY